MKSIITVLTFGLLTCGIAQANSDDKKILQLVKGYETALNASDTEKVLHLYGQSPTFMPQHAPAQVGREAIKVAYENVFKTIDLDIQFTIHEVDIYGSTAWARTSSAGKTKILANNQTVTEGNNELFIFKKENEQWKIHQYLFSTNQPRQ